MIKNLIFSMLLFSACTSEISCSTPIELQIKALESRQLPEKAKIIHIHVPEEATVADLLLSKKRGHLGFNIPTIPRFSKRYPYSLARILEEYKGHYKLNNGTMLTAAAMERFANNAHLLFYNRPDRAQELRNTLDATIQAHADWCPCKTTDRWEIPNFLPFLDNLFRGFLEKNVNGMPPEDRNEKLAVLHMKEDAVFRLLQELPLKDPAVRQLLEKILSTSHSPTVDYKALNFLAPHGKSLWEIPRATPNLHKKARPGFLNDSDKALLQPSLSRNGIIFVMFLYSLAKEVARKGIIIGLPIAAINGIACLLTKNAPQKMKPILTVTIYPALALMVFFVSKRMLQFFNDVAKGEYNQIAEPKGGIKVFIELQSFPSAT